MPSSHSTPSSVRDLCPEPRGFACNYRRAALGLALAPFALSAGLSCAHAEPQTPVMAPVALAAPAMPVASGISANVNPLVGTAEHGHTYPGATVPFGLVQLSPDTPLQGWDGSSG